MKIKYKLNGREVTQEEFAKADRPEVFNDMVESGIAPGCMTDDVFLAGRCNGNQFEGQPQIGDLYKSIAREAGVDVQGKVYLSGLAERPGDPEAWVSGRGDVQRVLEKRGWGSDGAVKVKTRNDVAPPPPIGIADDLVETYTERRIEADPGQAERPREEVKAEVRDAIKPHWVKD